MGWKKKGKPQPEVAQIIASLPATMTPLERVDGIVGFVEQVRHDRVDSKKQIHQQPPKRLPSKGELFHERCLMVGGIVKEIRLGGGVEKPPAVKESFDFTNPVFYKRVRRGVFKRIATRE